MSVKCGNCGERHDTVAEVRACYDMPDPELSEHATERRNNDWSAWSSADRERAQASRVTCSGDQFKLEDGIYRRPSDGQIYKVYHTVHGANVQVAKALVLLDESKRYRKIVRGKDTEIRAVFVYEGKRPLASLRPEYRMSLEDAEKYGSLYGVCVNCGRTLTLEKSIARGMGSWCAGQVLRQ